MRYNHFDMLPERAFLKVGGRITLEGGGGGPSAPTTTTNVTTNIPEWLQDPTKRMVARGETLSEQPYQTYTGQRTAGFTPAQQAAFQQIYGLSEPEQYGQAAQSIAGAQEFGAVGALQAMGYQPTQFTQHQMRGPQTIGASNVIGTGYDAAGAQAAGDIYGTGYDAAGAQAAGDIYGTGYDAAQARYAQDVTGTGYDAAQAQYAPQVQGTGYNAQGVNAAPDITAQDLQYFQMQSPESWTQAGTQAAYMSPYQKAVTDIAKREAVGEAAMLNREMAGKAAKAGAFGGSRFGIEQALLGSKLATNLSDIQTKGSEAAYQAGLGQFNTEQAARQAANVQNLQAALGVQSLGAGQNLAAQQSNQQMRQQANLASQSAYNQALQFGATQEQAAQLANQAAYQQTSMANQAATNQAAQFGAANQQAANLANQAAYQQTSLANQQALNQAGQFAAAQTMTAQQANQQVNQQTALANQQALNQAGQFAAAQTMTAQQANQQVNQQANLASQQAYNQALQFGATQAQAAQIANQAAKLTADQATEQLRYQTKTQNLQARLTTQQQQDAARQAAAALNLQGAQFGSSTGLQAGTQLANLGTAQQAAELNRIQALSAAGEQQQSMEQQKLSQAYADYLEQRDWEKNQLGYLSGLIRGTPFSTTQTTSGSVAGPTGMSQALSGALGVAGLASLLKKKGGVIDKTEGMSKRDKKAMMGDGLAKAGLYKAMKGA